MERSEVCTWDFFQTGWDKRVSAQKMGALVRRHVPGVRASAKVSFAAVVRALVARALHGSGKLSDQVKRGGGRKVSESALSQRRQRLCWEFFEELLDSVLRPLCRADRHPFGFYRGMRLVGFDGTQFSLRNTPRLLAHFNKAASRRFAAAFAKLPTSMLIELPAHNPLALAVGREQESEWALSRRLLGKLEKGWLLLADRNYGTGKTVHVIEQSCRAQGAQWLIRVRGNLKVTVLQELDAGSALVKVRVQDDQGRKHWLVVREICARVGRPGRASSAVRFWTSLPDARRHPSEELVRLYAQRWEQETYYRQIKLAMRRSGDLLDAQTQQSAAQELAALALASALIAEARLESAEASATEPIRISFTKVLAATLEYWTVMEVTRGLMMEGGMKKAGRRLLKRLREEALLPPRRKRSCPRAVRQPIGKMPRLVENASWNGPIHIEWMTAGQNPNNTKNKTVAQASHPHQYSLPKKKRGALA